MIKLGLVGFPIAHSQSPKLFDALFASSKLEGQYALFEHETIDRESLQQLFHQHGLTGINVTIPLKQRIMDCLDQIHPLAERIGAVNTVVFDAGQFIGYNTDYQGIKVSLNLLKTPLNRVMLLGDGGASRAVQTVLSDFGIPFDVVSRRGKDYNFLNLRKEWVADHNVWINATPVGSPKIPNEYLPLPYSVLSDEFAIFDLVYDPMPTPLMQTAELYGAETLGGLIMLKEQAKQAWTYFHAAYYKNL